MSSDRHSGSPRRDLGDQRDWGDDDPLTPPRDPDGRAAFLAERDRPPSAYLGALLFVVGGGLLFADALRISTLFGLTPPGTTLTPALLGRGLLLAALFVPWWLDLALLLAGAATLVSQRPTVRACLPGVPWRPIACIAGVALAGRLLAWVFACAGVMG